MSTENVDKKKDDDVDAIDDKKNGVNVSSLIVAVFAFYLIVGCNFLPQLFNCRIQNLANESMIFKHLFGFFILLFLVVNISPDFQIKSYKDIFRNILISLIIYVWFVITTRSTLSLIIVNLIVLIIVYIVYMRKTVRKSEGQDVKSDHIIIYVLMGINAVISVIGFGLYMREKKLEYGDKFKFSTFLSGSVKCKGYTPEYAKTKLIKR